MWWFPSSGSRSEPRAQIEPWVAITAFIITMTVMGLMCLAVFH